VSIFFRAFFPLFPMIYDINSPLFRSFLTSTGEDRKRAADRGGMKVADPKGTKA